MLNRTEALKNKIVDFVTAKERLLNPPSKETEERKRIMKTAYANRRKSRIFVSQPL